MDAKLTNESRKKTHRHRKNKQQQQRLHRNKSESKTNDDEERNAKVPDPATTDLKGKERQGASIDGEKPEEQQTCGSPLPRSPSQSDRTIMVKIRDTAASSSLACSSLVRSFAFSPSLETALVFLEYSSSPSSASLFHLQKPKASNKQSTEVKTRGEKTRKTTKLITQQREEALQRQKQKTAVAGNPRETMIACKDNTRKPRETRQRLAREREIETETQRDGDGEREREREKRETQQHTSGAKAWPSLRGRIERTISVRLPA